MIGKGIPALQEKVLLQGMRLANTQSRSLPFALACIQCHEHKEEISVLRSPCEVTRFAQESEHIFLGDRTYIDGIICKVCGNFTEFHSTFIIYSSEALSNFIKCSSRFLRKAISWSLL